MPLAYSLFIMLLFHDVPLAVLKQQGVSRVEPYCQSVLHVCLQHGMSACDKYKYCIVIHNDEKGYLSKFRSDP